jgi:hypothetical protein
MASISKAQKMQFMLRARAKKEQDAAAGEGVAGVDPLNQLIVAGGATRSKSKRKNEGRISISIPGKGSEAGTSSKGDQPATKKFKTSGPEAASDVGVVSSHGIDEERTSSPPRPAATRVPAASSPWDPLFNPELFLERMVEMSGDGARFGSTSTDELLKLSLGHELKGLLLNYALALRQKQEVSGANEKMKVISQELDDMEKKVKSAQDKFVAEMEVAQKESKKALEDLEKDHEAAIQKLKEEHTKEVKALKEASSSRDALLEDLIKEKGAWAEEKATLEETIGSQYDEGFNFALDQVKVLFLDIDAERLGEANVLMVIKDGALVPYELLADYAP